MKDEQLKHQTFMQALAHDVWELHAELVLHRQKNIPMGWVKPGRRRIKMKDKTDCIFYGYCKKSCDGCKDYDSATSDRS